MKIKIFLNYEVAIDNTDVGRTFQELVEEAIKVKREYIDLKNIYFAEVKENDEIGKKYEIKIEECKF